MNNDHIDIPIDNLEMTESPGIYRVRPNKAFLNWVARNSLILIVEPTKEQYEQWKKVATERPESWEATVLSHPSNQHLFARVR